MVPSRAWLTGRVLAERGHERARHSFFFRFLGSFRNSPSHKAVISQPLTNTRGLASVVPVEVPEPGQLETHLSTPPWPWGHHNVP